MRAVVWRRAAAAVGRGAGVGCAAPVGRRIIGVAVAHDSGLNLWNEMAYMHLTLFSFLKKHQD